MNKRILFIFLLLAFLLSSCRISVKYEKKETNILNFSTDCFEKYNDITLGYEEEIELTMVDSFVSYYSIKKINKDNIINSDKVLYYVIDETGDVLAKFKELLSKTYILDKKYNNINENKMDYECYLTQKESQIIIEYKSNVEMCFENNNCTTNYFIIRYVPKVEF